MDQIREGVGATEAQSPVQSVYTTGQDIDSRLLCHLLEPFVEFLEPFQKGLEVAREVGCVSHHGSVSLRRNPQQRY